MAGPFSGPRRPFEFIEVTHSAEIKVNGGSGPCSDHIRRGSPGLSIKAYGLAIISERHVDGPARREINEVPTAVITKPLMMFSLAC